MYVPRTDVWAQKKGWQNKNKQQQWKIIPNKLNLLITEITRKPKQSYRHAHGTVARRLCIDVHNDDNDNAWQRGPLWPHGMGPITCFQQPIWIYSSRFVVWNSYTQARTYSWPSRMLPPGKSVGVYTNKTIRGYSITESGFRFVVNLDLDSVIKCILLMNQNPWILLESHFTCAKTSAMMSANDYKWFKKDIYKNNCCKQTAPRLWIFKMCKIGPKTT